MKIHSITVGSPTASGTGATPMLLIHGLDSSSATWKNVMKDLSALSTSNNNNNSDNNCNNQGRFVIAMDCRGCGYSADIDPTNFSLSNLVEDVHDCLTFHNNNNLVNNNEKVILLGHSMGARIALSYAATYPHRIKCLIMEDMDIARRPTASAPFAVKTTTATTAIFDRFFHSQQEAVQTLLQAGYPADRVDSWVRDGRIHYRPDLNKWWSNVNPDFRRLCYQHVVDTDYGERDYNKLISVTTTTTSSSSARAGAGNQQQEEDDLAPYCSMIPVHVLVAADGPTICSQDSLQQMIQRNKHCKLHHFPSATHSIHSTDRDNFLRTIQEILNECDSA